MVILCLNYPANVLTYDIKGVGRKGITLRLYNVAVVPVVNVASEQAGRKELHGKRHQGLPQAAIECHTTVLFPLSPPRRLQLGIPSSPSGCHYLRGFHQDGSCTGTKYPLIAREEECGGGGSTPWKAVT